MATVGSASVDIVPSVKGFQQKLDAELQNIGDIKLKVDVDVTEARAKIDELVRARTVNIGVNLDSSAAALQLAELERARTVQIRVDLDDAIAKAKLAELTRDRSTTVTVNTVSGSNSAGDAGGGAGGGGLLAAALPLAALAIPLGAAAIGVGAALGAGAAAAVGALGSLKLGLSGVGTAVQAVQAQQAAAGADAIAYGNAQASAAASVASAAAGVANAQRSAGTAAEGAARAVIAAQTGVVDAQRTATANITAAIATENAARTSVADAQRSATAAVASALVQQESAERSLTNAQQAETNAQNALTLARKTAQQQIEDLTNSVADGTLAQRGAALNAEQASASLALVNANMFATPLQRAQAQLAYDQARQQITDLATRQQRLIEQKAAADKAGVDGSTLVLNAQQAVGNATTNTATAQDALARANDKVTEAQRAGAESVAKAQDALLVSTAKVTEARRSGAESVAKAEQAVTTALEAQSNSAASSAAAISGAQAGLSNALRQQAVAAAAVSSSAAAAAAAFALLTPAAQDFATFVTDTLQPALKTLKDSASSNLLPGLQAGLLAAMPLLPVFADIIANASKALGDLFSAAGRALNTPFYQEFFTFIRDSAGPAMKIFGEIIGNFITGSLGLFQAFAPVISQVGGGIAGLATSFANFGTTLATNTGFQAFLAYVIASGPLVASFLGSLIQLVGNLIQGLAPLGAVLLTVTDSLAKFLVTLGPNGLLYAIAAVSTVIVGLGVAFAPISVSITAIAVGVTALVALFVNAYQNIQPFRDYIDQNLVPALKTLAGIIVDGASKALATLQKAFEDNRPAITTLATVIGRVLEIFISLAGFLAAGAISLALQILAQTVSDVADAITLLGKAYTFVVTANGKFKDTTEESVAVVGRFTGNIEGLTPKIDLLKVSDDNLRDAQDNLNTAVQKSIDKFTILNGGAAAQQKANDNLAAATDALTKSVQTNGTSLDGNTAAGRANKAGIEANLSALNDKITADLKANTSTMGYAAALEIAKQQLIDGRQKLIDQAGQLGINQTAAKGMVDQLLLTPKELETKYATVDADKALAAAQNLKNVLDGIVDKTVTVTISGGYKEIAAQNAQGAGRTAIAATNAEGGHIQGEGTGTSDSILSYLSNGEFVVKASETAKHLPLLHALNDGQVPGYAAGGTVNIVQKANLGGAQDGISGFLKNLDFSKVLGNSASSAPGAGDSVTRWAPVILQALGLQGLPANFLAGVENVIKFESGGNPTAINLTDSNAVAGHPSQGLMQTIPTTFAAYAGPYASRGITDPLANIYAGVAYAMANYGPGFFANGGRHDSSGGYLGYDTGGYIPPGVSSVYNGTGKPEMVFTPEQLSKRDAQGGQGSDPEVKNLLRQLISVAGSQGGQFADALNGVASNSYNQARGARY